MKRSVIKLEAIPTGLEEDQLYNFFSQFGDITRYCLKRRRHGQSLREAYIEYNHPEIAQIVQDTLSYTSMYGAKIEAKTIKPERVRGSEMFKCVTIEKARLFKKHDNERRRWYNCATIANLEFQFDAWHERLLENEKSNIDNLKQHGIEYNFDGLEKEIKRQQMMSDKK